MVNAQEWLDENYPQGQRKTIKILNLYNKNFTGTLDLNDFVGLEWLDFSDNKLTAWLIR